MTCWGDVYFAPIVMLLDPSVTANARGQHTKGQIEKRLQKLKRCPNFLKRFSLEGECLIYDKDVRLGGQRRICVPKTKTKEILKKVHDDELHGGHFGIYNTFLKAATIPYRPHQFKDVSQYVKTCMTCQTTKQGQTTSGLLLQEPPPVKRWEVIGIDFVLGLPVTPRGYDMILTVIDHLTKRAHFFLLLSEPCPKIHLRCCSTTCSNYMDSRRRSSVIGTLGLQVDYNRRSVRG